MKIMQKGRGIKNQRVSKETGLWILSRKRESVFQRQKGGNDFSESFFIGSIVFKKKNFGLRYRLESSTTYYYVRLTRIPPSGLAKILFLNTRAGVSFLAEDRAFYYLRSVYSNYGSENAKIALAFQREIINNIVPYVQPDLIHCNDWMTGLLP